MHWTETECLESTWPSRTRGGHARRSRVMAHRKAWEDEHGPIPPGMNVCHHCDNPPCINPDHLFLGTQKDNAVDMSRKGRHGQAVMTERELELALFLIECEVATQAQMADRLGVAQSTLSRARRRLTWSWR